MRKISKKTGWRLALTVILLGMLVCVYVLIHQTPDLDRAYLIQKGIAADEPLELQPGEVLEQGFFAYKSFDHLILNRINTASKIALDVEILRNDELLFTTEAHFESNEAEKEFPVSGERGTFVIRLTNRGENSVMLPQLSRQKYSTGDWPGKSGAALQIEVYRTTGSVKWCFYIAVLMISVLSLVVLWGRGSRWTPEKAIIYILTFCLAYIFLFPAWNINDFGKHFATAYACANQLLGVEVEEPDDLMIREDDAFFFEWVFSDPYQTFYQPTTRSYDDALEYLFQRTENNQLVLLEGITGVHRGYGIWNYLPYILGIIIARLLSLNLVTAVFLARLCGVAVYVMVIWLAMRKLPAGIIVPVTILSCMPVGIMNLTAISYDAPCYVAILYLFACIFSLRERYSRADAISLVICSLAVGLVKRGAYAPVLLSLLLLLRGRKPQRIRLVLYCVIAGGMGLALNYRGIFLGDSGISVIHNEGRGTYDMAWAISHPLDYFVMMIRTYLRQTDKIYSVIGKHLGRHMATIPDYVCGLFYLVLGMSVLQPERGEHSIRKLDGYERFWIWLPVLIMVALLPAMILDYTLLAWDTTDNVQGRYYLPLLVPLVMMACHNLREKFVLQVNWSKGFLWGAGFLHLLSVYYIWLTFLRGMSV